MKRINRTCIAALTAMMMFSGCGRREVPEETSAPEQAVEVIHEMDDVEDGGYYVYRNGVYEKLYVGSANYDVKAMNNTDENRTLWFMDDFERIPTMYKGDSLIYKTSAALSESVYIERFEYCGYTIGITGLKKTESGRYSLKLATSARTINPNSDAMQLAKLASDVVIIDRFGGADLRSGNVSNGGCILGLSKGKTYAADVYVGTYYHDMRLTADTIALTSMESAKTVDYDFLQSQLISIHIPDYYNSGYYLINGYGIVRYVNGTSYNEDTDFNIPNIPPEEKKNSSEDDTQEEAKRYYDEETKITVDRESEYTITIRCNASYDIRPGAILYYGDNAFQFKRTSNSKVLKLTAVLEEGEYLISLSGLEDGYYVIDIEDLEPEETEEESRE